MKKSLFTYPHIPNQHFLVHPFGNMRASKSFSFMGEPFLELKQTCSSSCLGNL